MTGRLLGAACLLLAVGACSESGGNDDDDVVVDPPENVVPGGVTEVDDGPGTSDLKFAASAEAADAGDYTTQFPIIDTRDVIAVIPVERAPGVFFVQANIYQPMGTPFNTLWRAYSSDADAPQTVMHPELGVDVAVLPVRPSDPPRLYVAIPVAGTQIPEFGLTGVFPVEVRFGADGDVEPAFESAFEIVMASGGGSL